MSVSKRLSRGGFAANERAGRAGWAGKEGGGVPEIRKNYCETYDEACGAREVYYGNKKKKINKQKDLKNLKKKKNTVSIRYTSAPFVVLNAARPANNELWPR